MLSGRILLAGGETLPGYGLGKMPGEGEEFIEEVLFQRQNRKKIINLG